MNTPELRHKGWFKKHLASSFLALALTLPGVSQAQSLISSAAFFSPEFQARKPGTPGLLTLTATFDSYSAGPFTQGNVTWRHAASGHTQAGLDVDVFLVGTAKADLQLAAFSRTQSGSLSFGREFVTTTSGLLSLLSPLLPALNGQILNASVANTWNSRATISNLSLNAGQLYTINFDVTRGAGLNLNALSYANFALLGNGVAIQNTDSGTLLNVLDLIRLGSGARPGEFQFYAPAGITSLDLVFTAATVADVTLVGGMPANQNVMEFSNFSLAPVPEVSSLALASLGMLLLLRRRRPCQI